MCIAILTITKKVVSVFLCKAMDFFLSYILKKKKAYLLVKICRKDKK